MKKEMAIFIINSLQNGGAERVVLNQAQEMNKRGYKVTIILIHDSIYYTVDSNINIIVLGKKCSKIGKIIRILNYAKRLDECLEDLSKKMKLCYLQRTFPMHILYADFQNLERIFYT